MTRPVGFPAVHEAGGFAGLVPRPSHPLVRDWIDRRRGMRHEKLPETAILLEEHDARALVDGDELDSDAVQRVVSACSHLVRRRARPPGLLVVPAARAEVAMFEMWVRFEHPSALADDLLHRLERVVAQAG